MRYSRCDRSFLFAPVAPHTLTHTHKATAGLGQHVSTKLSFLSRLHQQMHTKARRNDSLEEYPSKRVLFSIRTLPQSSRFTTSPNPNTTRSRPDSKICLAHLWATTLLHFWLNSGWAPGPKLAHTLKTDSNNFLWPRCGPGPVKRLLFIDVAQIWPAYCRVNSIILCGPGLAQTL